ncbi:MAG: DUF4296 domain-containing protein [Bacteroidia bacterium]
MRHYLLIFFTILVVSCSQNKTVSIPDFVLPEDKMAEVMVDVHLLEATLNINTFSRDKITKGNMAPATDVLKKHGITKKQYDESFAFYSQNPQLLSEVYLKVLNDLSKLQAQVMHDK